MTRPEQSNSLGPDAPQMYGSPRRVRAASRALAPTLLPPGIVMLGELPVWLKTAMAWVMVELLTLLIWAWICLVFAFMEVSSAVTLAICCCAVSLARLSAASALDRSVTRVPFV